MSTTIDSKEDVFQIAAKAQKLLQEILSSNKAANSKNATLQHNEQILIKQEPIVHHHSSPPPTTSTPFNQQQQQFYLQQQQQPNQQQFNYYSPQSSNLQPQQYILHPPPVVAPHATPPPPTQQNLIINPTFYMQTPPPILSNASASATIVQQPYFYSPHQQSLSQVRPAYYYSTPYHQPPPASTIVQMQQHHYYQQQNHSHFSLNTTLPPPALNSTNLACFRKRKFGELNNFDNNNNINNSRFKAVYQAKATSYFTGANSQTTASSLTSSPSTTSSKTSDSGLNDSGQVLNEEEEDLNLMRERELKELKCKSVVEKMSVFLKYYQQFKEAYIQRVQSLECSDSLKLQFHSLVKFLSEYENLLAELNMMITEHEHDHCKNNHRKTKKFFNKTKAFIRYECNKRLQSNIFEYRRLINSQDRYAGMYDLLDMNSYLISLLPDIGVSIRRYINRCEKAREQEQLEEEEEDAEYQQTWYSEENSTDSNELNGKKSSADANDLTIPTFKEYVALNRGEEEDEDEDEEDDEDEEEFDEEDDDDNIDDATKENKKKKRKLSTNESNGATSASDQPASNKNRAYESFSKGIDSLNRYLLKRVDEEETLDELVKERIVKWINKRQAKYILIFSEVDKLLNQHKAGECYSKFHSYLLFNLGKLVTVCDSYHQKLKELLYSTTIRRKKKRKKVKLLPESMTDVFNEIIDLKKALELAKISIKRCNMMNSNLTSSSSKEKQF